MSFRRRTVLLAAGAVAAAIVIASVVVYFVTRGELIAELDHNLHAMITPGQPQAVKIRQAAGVKSAGALLAFGEQGGEVPEPLARPAAGKQAGVVISTARHEGKHGEVVTIERETVEGRSGKTVTFPPHGVAVHLPSLVLPTQKIGGPVGYVQLFQANGNVLHSGTARKLPVTPATRAVAEGRRPAFFSTVTLGGTHARTLTARAPEGGVWQVALPLAATDSTLSRLRLVLAIVCLGGDRAWRLRSGCSSREPRCVPVRRLTGAAERVARTQDLGHRIDARNSDELGRLAASFNTMLAALERARLAQRQLVSDASHELRTPLTSVQANLDALALGDRLAPHERARVVAAAQAQLRELTVLVGDLADLSRTECRADRARGRAARSRRRGRRRAGAPACSRLHVRARHAAVPGPRCAGAPRSRDHEPARQRLQMGSRRPDRDSRP